MSTVATVCIATPSHFSYARSLLHSVRRFVPESQNFLVIPEIGIPDPAVLEFPEGTTALTQAEVVGDSHTTFALTATYTPFELSCALKPYALTHLLNSGYDTAIYLDADTRLYARPQELLQGSDHSEFSAAPHLLSPSESTPQLEMLLLRAGALNAGAIGVGQKSERFLSWWTRRVTSLGQDAPWEGLFVDQKWLDLALALFECHIVRDWGFNVGPWNLHERPLRLRDDEFWVREESPLTLFHFSRFTPERRSMADYPNADPLNHLLDEYATDLVRSGWQRPDPRMDGLAKLRSMYATTLRRRRSIDQVLAHNSWDVTSTTTEKRGLTYRERLAAFEAPRALKRDWYRFFGS